MPLTFRCSPARPRAFLFVAILLCASCAPALTQPAAVRYVPAAEIRASGTGVTRPLVVDTLAHRGSYSVLEIVRTADGEAEQHEAWDDVFVVYRGRATLLYGGTIGCAQPGAPGTQGQPPCPRSTGPGELRGGQITGGTTQALGEGDMMVIPAGVPHQVLVPQGETAVFVVIKAPTPPR